MRFSLRSILNNEYENHVISYRGSSFLLVNAKEGYGLNKGEPVLRGIADIHTHWCLDPDLAHLREAITWEVAKKSEKDKMFDDVATRFNVASHPIIEAIENRARGFDVGSIYKVINLWDPTPFFFGWRDVFLAKGGTWAITCAFSNVDKHFNPLIDFDFGLDSNEYTAMYVGKKAACDLHYFTIVKNDYLWSMVYYVIELLKK